MLRQARPVSTRAALTACVLAALAVTPALAEETSVTVTGEIEVAEYDDNDKVVSVMVYDSEWGSVLISREGKGQELLSHVGAVVKMTGKIVELDDDSGYSHTIRVTAYTVEEPAERWDDPDLDPEG